MCPVSGLTVGGARVGLEEREGGMDPQHQTLLERRVLVGTTLCVCACVVNAAIEWKNHAKKQNLESIKYKLKNHT